MTTENEKSDQSGSVINSQSNSSDNLSSYSNSDRHQQTVKSPLDLETKSEKAISSENLSKKSSESTPLKFKQKQPNEKDLDFSREINKEYFNDIKQDDFNKACEIDDMEYVPHFQRVYISGDDNSGVSLSKNGLFFFVCLYPIKIWNSNFHHILSNEIHHFVSVETY